MPYTDAVLVAMIVVGLFLVALGALENGGGP
jgi:hypothetical protein